MSPCHSTVLLPYVSLGRIRFALVIALVLIAGVLIVFLPTLRNGFVWDDMQYILGNAHVTSGLTQVNLRWALTSFEAGNWHPLTWVSHMLDVELFGLDPRGHHLANVLIHLGNTLLLFVLLLRLTGAAWKGFLVAALFAVHPLHVESVAWIAERKDVLSTFFGFLAVYAHCRYARKPGLSRYLAVVFLFVAVLAAKQMLVTLPCLLLLLDFWPLGRLGVSSWRRPVLEKIPLFALAALFGSVAMLAQGSANAFSSYPLAARVSNAIVSYLRYCQKTVAPVDLAVFYPHPQLTLPLGLTIAAFLALTTMTVLAGAGRHRRPWLTVGWLWFLWTLFPVIGLIQVGEQAMADRYSYVPIIGLFILAVWGAAEFATPRPALRTLMAGAASVTLIGLSTTSLVQVGHWQSNLTLFFHAAQAVPGNWTAHFQLGSLYQRQGRDAEAIEQYLAAISARAGFSEALNNLGMVFAGRGDPAQAATWYRAAIRADAGNWEAHNNLGGALMEHELYREAQTCFLQASRLQPEAPEPQLNLGLLLLRERRWVEAMAPLASVVQIQPNSATARNALGIALFRQGRHEEAAASFREALRLNPGDGEISDNLARAIATSGSLP